MMSRKFIGLIVISIILAIFYVVASFNNQLDQVSNQLIEAIKWIFGIYVAGNVGEAITNNIKEKK